MTNDDELFTLSMDQEETIWLLNTDKVRMSNFIKESVRIIHESKRPPCKWYQFRCKR